MLRSTLEARPRRAVERRVVHGAVQLGDSDPPGDLIHRTAGVDLLRLRALAQTYTTRTFTRSKSDLAAFKNYPVVVAVVSYDEPAEQNQPAAFYKLMAKGVVQPGGGPAQG